MRAFSENEAAFGLMLGIFLTLIITVLFYATRKVLTLRESIGNCIPEGTKTMIPPMIILILAWTLKAMTTSLGASEFVANAVGTASGNCSTSCRRSSLWRAVFSRSPQAHPGEHSVSRPQSLPLCSQGQRDHAGPRHLCLYGGCRI
ncbi:MAG: hypothetical protein LIO91_11440 [Bacteroidales bacterium]|nr:hypothetical protein [Bacteroidales bacterium]